jgi:hypothetical protein
MITPKRFLLFSALTLPLLACALFQNPADRIITGSGRTTTEARTISGVTSVVLEGSGEVEIVQGAAESLTIEAEDNLLPLITSAVQAGTLRLGFDRATWREAIRPTQPIRFVLTVPALQSIDLAGRGSLHAADLQADPLALHLTGAGTITLDHLEAGALDVRLDGSGNVIVAGRVDDQTVVIAGSGQYQAGDLDSQTARVTITGTGDVVVWARADLSAEISGSGTVSYWGDPVVSRRAITGTGDINPLGVK